MPRPLGSAQLTRTRLILLVYCALVTGVVLIVPWTYTRGEVRFGRQYAFLFADMDRMSVDYGMIALELVVLSCLAGVAYLLQDYFDKYAVSVTGIWRKRRVITDAAASSWNRYWDEELKFFRWRLSRSSIFLWVGGIAALCYMIGIDGNSGWRLLGLMTAMVLLLFL